MKGFAGVVVSQVLIHPPQLVLLLSGYTLAALMLALVVREDFAERPLGFGWF